LLLSVKTSSLSLTTSVCKDDSDLAVDGAAAGLAPGFPFTRDLPLFSSIFTQCELNDLLFECLLDQTIRVFRQHQLSIMHSFDMSFHVVLPRPKSGGLLLLARGIAQANHAKVSISSMLIVDTSLMTDQVVDVAESLSIAIAFRLIADKVSAVGLLVFPVSRRLDHFSPPFVRY
jgi:hypothetical protein